MRKNIPDGSEMKFLREFSVFLTGGRKKICFVSIRKTDRTGMPLQETDFFFLIRFLKKLCRLSVCPVRVFRNAYYKIRAFSKFGADVYAPSVKVNYVFYD